MVIETQIWLESTSKDWLKLGILSNLRLIFTHFMISLSSLILLLSTRIFLRMTWILSLPTRKNWLWRIEIVGACRYGRFLLMRRMMRAIAILQKMITNAMRNVFLVNIESFWKYKSKSNMKLSLISN